MGFLGDWLIFGASFKHVFEELPNHMQIIILYFGSVCTVAFMLSEHADL